MTFAPELLHPELRTQTRAWLVLRSSFPFMYFFPYDSRVAWYGGAVRPNGGQGMYMTAAQARDWTSWVVTDHVIGPQ